MGKGKRGLGGRVTWQWGPGIGELRAGKREVGALSIAGVTLTLFAVRGSLANLSGEFIMTDLSGSFPLAAPSPAGQFVRWGVTSPHPFLGISSRPHGNATYRLLPNWHSPGVVAASTIITTPASLSSMGPPLRQEGGMDPPVSGFIRGQGTGRP